MRFVRPTSAAGRVPRETFVFVPSPAVRPIASGGRDELAVEREPAVLSAQKQAASARGRAAPNQWTWLLGAFVGAALFSFGCGPVGRTGADAAMDAAGPLDAGVDADVPEPWPMPYDAGTPDPVAPHGIALECHAGRNGLDAEGDCSRCGRAMFLCLPDGAGGWAWTQDSECRAQGQCVPGTVDTRRSLGCGFESATCTNECIWGEYAQTQPDVASPECQYGEARIVDADGCEGRLTRNERCDETCHWSGVVSACGGGCLGTRRTSPVDREEVCVPAGLVSLGFPGSGSEDAWQSAFYIDRYPVTYRRYRACVEAGACPAKVLPPEADVDPDFVMREANNWAAKAFCRWDGGRVLPSVAMWERAYKGPAPRNPGLTYDPAVLTCAQLPAHYTGQGCVANVPPPGAWVYERFDAYPLAESWFGVRHFAISGKEWTSDLLGSVTDPWAVELRIDPVVRHMYDKSYDYTTFMVAGGLRSHGTAIENSSAVSSRSESQTALIRCARSAR